MFYIQSNSAPVSQNLQCLLIYGKKYILCHSLFNGHLDINIESGMTDWFMHC